MTFEQKLQKRIEQTGSHLCVGLDPRVDRIQGSVAEFLEQVVEETAPLAAAFKPNIAYFEALGTDGYRMLEQLLETIGGRVPVILDVKRSDIAESQKYYARAYFENWNVDAVTINPLLGYDSVEPYLAYEGKGIYLLGVTSNPGAHDFLLQKMGERFLFEEIQRMRTRAASLPGTVGLVAGLTNISDDVLERIEDMPLLIPGLGAQGGDLGKLNPAGRRAPLVINVSRGVLYGDDGASFADRAKNYVEKIRQGLDAHAAEQAQA